MGVYIKGMEMPKNKPLLVKINPDGSVSTTAKNGYKKYQAVPVPPNGRLIDANKIGLTDFEIILCQKGNPFKNALKMLLEKIENAPTVIPAEEGEK